MPLTFLTARVANQQPVAGPHTCLHFVVATSPHVFQTLSSTFVTLELHIHHNVFRCDTSHFGGSRHPRRFTTPVAAFCLAVLPKYRLLCTSELTSSLTCSDGRTASFSGLVSP